MSSKPRNNNQSIRLINHDGSEVAPRVLTVSTIADVSDTTYTPAQMLGGLINRDPNGASRDDAFPDAVDIIAALGGANNVPLGTSFRLIIRNTADAAETVYIDSSPNTTIVGNEAIAQNNLKEFLFVVTSSTTLDAYALGSQDFTS
jgi:hypothetical protein